MDEVLRVYGSDEKIEHVETTMGRSVRDVIFEAGATIGAARVVSKQEGLNLRFQDMRYRFETNVSIKIDVDRQYSHIMARSDKQIGWDVNALMSATDRVLDASQEKKKLCRGHDVIRILAKGLRRQIGSDSQFDSDTKYKELEKVLRLTYNFELFRGTRMYSDIVDWERYSGYRVFGTN